MINLIKTKDFDKWISKLKDKEAKSRIEIRLDALRMCDHKGNFRHLSGKVFELKIDSGPGYRVYFMEHNIGTILLLGGAKKSQERDIKKAVKMAKEVAKELEKENSNS